jgi:hypothetical protein
LIRSAKTRRTLAWLGLFAIALIAIVPTFSQLLVHSRTMAAAPIDHAHDGPHADHHAAPDPRVAGHDDMLATQAGSQCLHNHGGKSDDCWKKCGYCDFLTQTPSLGGFEYITVLAARYPQLPTPRAFSQRAHVVEIRAAQPRGPPLFV